MRSFEKGAAGALESGFRAHIEVFDAGEQSAGGDVQAIGEDGYAEYLLSRPGGEYLYVPEFDGLPQTVNELLGYGLAIPEGFLQDHQRLGQTCLGDKGDLDRLHQLPRA